MSNERIDLDAIEREWNRYQSDGPVEVGEIALRIPKLIAELKRCYEIIDSIPEGILDEPCEGCNTLRIGYYDNNVCKHDSCDKCVKCCVCNI